MRVKTGTRITTVAALLLIVTASVTALFAWYSSSDKMVHPPEEIEDYLFFEAKQLSDFTLTGPGNQVLDLDHLRGKWSFIFFGYTHCPDVCPTTLASLGTAFKVLAKNPMVSLKIQGIFVSVDPGRDSPESLKAYVDYFHPDFIGVTGDTAQVAAFSRQMGALYTIDREGSPGDYLVTHNSSIFVVDPRGRLYGRLPPPHEPEAIAEIFTRIDAFYRQQEEQRWRFF
jgi:protein SCO1